MYFGKIIHFESGIVQFGRLLVVHRLGMPELHLSWCFTADWGQQGSNSVLPKLNHCLLSMGFTFQRVLKSLCNPAPSPPSRRACLCGAPRTELCLRTSRGTNLAHRLCPSTWESCPHLFARTWMLFGEWTPRWSLIAQMTFWSWSCRMHPCRTKETTSALLRTGRPRKDIAWPGSLQS